MACNKCKKKKSDNLIAENEMYVERLQTKVGVVMIIWGALGIYGFISLILDIFSLL